MSKEVVSNFFQELETDDVLQEQVKNANNSTSIIQTASKRGYEFTAQELQEYMQEAATNEELSLEKLDLVAGGNTNINGGTNNVNDGPPKG